MPEDTKPQKARIAVLGSGSWGTALAHHARRTGAAVSIWGRDASVLESISSAAQNPRYVQGLALAAGIIAEPDLERAVVDKDLIIVALPSSVLRGVLKNAGSALRSGNAVVLSGIKGLESDTLETPSQVLADELGSREKIAVLGGPSFAGELIQGYPTAVTIAAYTPETAEYARRVLHFGNLRVYTSADVIGVEFGGAVKNVIALAAGLVDGVGMGENARAALITRGLAELQCLIEALGGDPRTITGLAGLGDLLLTAVGNQSRNRQVGLRLGRGEDLAKITKELGQVAEGVRSTHLILKLAKQHNIDMPIVEQTDAVLSGRRSVEEAVGALLNRQATKEIKS